MIIGVDLDEADIAISNLLSHVRAVSKPGRRLSLNHPAGENVHAFIDSGFKKHNTLIWMKSTNHN